MTYTQGESKAAYTEIADVEAALNEFFRWPDRNILLLKGSWGAGKSYFLRDYISRGLPIHGGVLLPKWIAYTSLFGASTIQQVEERIFGALQPIEYWNRTGPKMAGEVLKELCKSFGLPLLGFGIPFPVSSLISHLLRTRDLCIVFDDLERTQGDRIVAEVLGLASSLAENSTASLKIILVCNAERLSAAGKEELAVYREKVIHTEVFYSPSPSELTHRFFHHSGQFGVMLRCLEIIGEGNIRIIGLVDHALTEIAKLFEENEASLSPLHREEIVRLAVFYYRATCQINSQWFMEYYRHSSAAALDGKKPELRDRNDFLAGQLRATYKELEDAVLEWLNYGFVSKKTLAWTVKKVRDQAWQHQFMVEYHRAHAAYDCTFIASTTQEVTAPISALLDEYCERLDLDMLLNEIELLSCFGVRSNKWLYRHLNAVAENLSLAECRTYLARLTLPSDRNLIQSRVNELLRRTSIKATLWSIVEKSDWEKDDMEVLVSFEPPAYRSWLESEEDTKTVQTLKTFLDLSSSSSSGIVQEARGKIIDAIKLMAENNRVNRMRAEHLFGIEINDGPPAEEDDEPLKEEE